ncbi:MAG: M23 family metallopeptidase [Bdellovibrionales bacterium]|nr:M23 family metallopeptidase [Bdellovibrionales bacterium]
MIQLSMARRTILPIKLSSAQNACLLAGVTLVLLAVLAPLKAAAEPRSPVPIDQEEKKPEPLAAVKSAIKSVKRTVERATSQPTRKPTPSSGTKQASSNTRPYQEVSEETTQQLENSMIALKEYSNHFSLNPQLMNPPESLDALEGIATEAVLAQIIRATYTEALRRGWKKTARYSVFPIHEIAATATTEVGRSLGFNSKSARVAVFGLKSGRINRGVILTSNYQSVYPGDLRTHFGRSEIVPMVEEAKIEYNAFALDILDRMRDHNKRLSEHLPVVGQAQTWVLGCEKTVAGKFCVNVRVFDATDTDTTVFYDALVGQRDPDERVRAIKAQKLAWPVKESYISRGFKEKCRGCDSHFGLDLATPPGTIIYSVQDGVVAIMKQLSGWGRTVVIEHTLPNGDKYISLYAHLSRYRKGLKVGTTVSKGEVLALSGNSGRSTGPHLHMEIRHATGDKEAVDMLRQPRSKIERPLDPLRVLDVFNVFVEGA